MAKKRSTRIILWVVFSILALILIAFVVRLGFEHVCQSHTIGYPPLSGGFCEYRWIGYDWIFNGP